MNAEETEPARSHVGEVPAKAARGRSVFANCLTIFLARSLWAISVFVTMPVIVTGIGAETLGIWESILAVGAAAAVLQTVTGGTLLWQIASHVGANQIDQARRYIGFGITATLVMFIAFVPLAYLCRHSVVDFLGVTPSLRATAEWLFPATVALLVLGGLNQTLMSALAGLQQSGTAATIQVAGLLVTAATNVLGILCGAGIMAMWYGTLAGFLVTFAALVIANWQAYGFLSLLPLIPSRRELAVVTPFAMLLLVSNVTILCRDQMDKVILTVIDSASSTGYFSIAQRLATIILQISVVVQLPLTAAIAASHARGEWDRIVRIYSQSTQWLGVMSCLAAVSICTLRTPLLITWFGHDVEQLHGFLATTVWGAAAAITLGAGGVALAKGIGRPGLETRYAVVTLLLTLVSKPVLIYLIGPIGALISSAASWGLGACLLLYLVHRETRLPSQLLWRSGLMVGIAGTLSLALWQIPAAWPMSQHRPTATAVLAGGTTLIALLYWWLLRCFHAAPDLGDLLHRVMPETTAVPHDHRSAA